MGRTIMAGSSSSQGQNEQDQIQDEQDDPNINRGSNVLGTPLKLCCNRPYKTGFYRDGFCCTGDNDFGVHTVCAIVTNEFLDYSKAQGNDLITPRPEYSFPGLKQGDKWCLCAARWEEARQAGKAPKVLLEATHIKSLDFVNLSDLMAHAITLP
eukprot:CAMPEP_0184694370 /NCGR_PEP_ID=MMETSP0313-20130426/2365_1 /TAXON_ID=2792 /ORGANISM="Porphyridium aerugineum, Strain SAG 1380-2" /LENGTH=153 /DNA_ID=CAMNT_0027152661 /DNA_START=267 /DNA_END=724 /DNA_ORIENTATION=-